MNKLFFLLLLLLGANCLPVAADEADLWKLSTTDKRSHYVGAPMANGGSGMLPWREPFSVRQVVLNHVFDAEHERGVSRVLKGINPFLLSMEIGGKKIGMNNISQWQQTVDMKNAMLCSSFVADGKAEVTYQICALRNMLYG